MNSLAVLVFAGVLILIVVPKPPALGAADYLPGSGLVSIVRSRHDSAALWDNRTMPERKRRPRDPNQLAYQIVQEATG